MSGRGIVIPALVIMALSYCAPAAGTPTGGAELYRHYCSPCHGLKGDGKGFNALNLDPRPANHTDAEFMSRRSDRGLFDAISGGGRAVGKSTLMPPWGGVLDDARIRALVRYLRDLCGCKGGG